MSIEIIDDVQGDQLPIETVERIRRGRDLITRYSKPFKEHIFDAMGTTLTLPVPEEMRGKRVKIKMEVL